MKVSKKVFDNGLRLVNTKVDSTEAVNILILVGAGSRYENVSEMGIAHFLEHMFFKGGEKYDTPKKVAETIDGIGGDFNAFTGKEYVGYYVKCASKDKEIAFDVLSDMLLKTKLAQKDIEKERGVIIEELNMYQDTPIYQIGWNFERLMFGDTPMGRDQIGIPETINSFLKEDFELYKKDLYSADNTVIAISGNIEESESIDLVNKYFQLKNLTKIRKKSNAVYNTSEESVSIADKKTEQAHLMLGYPCVNYNDELAVSARILSVIMGGNMSSRMFLKIREEQGLCYSISSSVDQYTDIGTFSVQAGIDLKRVPQALEAIVKEVELSTKNSATEEELNKAKNYLKGKLTLRLEDSEEISSFYGTQEVLKNNSISIKDYFTKIDSVSLEDLSFIAKKYFKKENCKLSIIGPFEDQKELFKNIIS